MNTNIPTVFNFNTSEVRTVLINDEPWFVAADVCAVLGVKNHRDALMHLDDDEKGVVSNDTLGGIQQMSVINESGLYALVLRSRKPEAKPFIKWVTREVLPSIRKTGQYIAQPYSVNPGDSLTKVEADTLRGMLEGAAKKAYPDDGKKQGAFIKTGWSKLKAHFKVTYRDIPRVEFTEAVSLISRHAIEGDYIPASATVDSEKQAKINVRELMLGGMSSPTVKLPDDVQILLEQRAVEITLEAHGVIKDYLARSAAYYGECGQPRQVNVGMAKHAINKATLSAALTHTFCKAMDRMTLRADMAIDAANEFRRDINRIMGTVMA